MPKEWVKKNIMKPATLFNYLLLSIKLSYNTTQYDSKNKWCKCITRVAFPKEQSDSKFRSTKAGQRQQNNKAVRMKNEKLKGTYKLQVTEHNYK